LGSKGGVRILGERGADGGSPRGFDCTQYREGSERSNSVKKEGFGVGGKGLSRRKRGGGTIKLTGRCLQKMSTTN